MVCPVVLGGGSSHDLSCDPVGGAVAMACPVVLCLWGEGVIFGSHHRALVLRAPSTDNFIKCTVSFCQFDTNLNVSGKREHQRRNCLYQTGL